MLDGDGVDNENADVESVSIQLGASASQSMTLEFKSWVPQVAVDVNGDQSGDVTDATESAFGTAVFYYGDDNDATNNAAGEVAGDGEEARIDAIERC